MKGHPEHFAAEAKGRRQSLNMTMLDVHAAGGPTVPTQVKAEGAELVDPKPVTFRRFDVAYGWEPGSAARVYWQGGQPTLVATARSGSPPGVPLVPGEMTTPLPLERLLALMAIQRDLNALAARSTHIPASTLAPVTARMDREIGAIVGGWATDLLEHNRREGGTGVHPLIEMAFADALAAPVGPDEPDAEERWYRRWLLGGPTAEQIDEATRARFEDRYQSRREGQR